MKARTVLYVIFSVVVVYKKLKILKFSFLNCRWQKKTIPLALTYTLEELRSDETYNIRIMARNVGGAGKPSNEVSAKTKKTPSKSSILMILL